MSLKACMTPEAVAWICIGVSEYTTELIIDMVGIRVYSERERFRECAV